MSTLKVNTIQNTSGVEKYLASAWVNFNGTGTVAIRASGNVTSITDNGTGDYTVNFTNAMVDASYSIVGTAKAPAGGYPDDNYRQIIVEQRPGTIPTTTAARIITFSSRAPGVLDCDYVSISVVR